jgi:hypothetical protein
MRVDPIEDRLDALEAEVAAAGDIASRLNAARAAMGLIHGILSDLTKDLSNAAEYDDDLREVDRLMAVMLT